MLWTSPQIFPLGKLCGRTLCVGDISPGSLSLGHRTATGYSTDYAAGARGSRKHSPPVLFPRWPSLTKLNSTPAGKAGLFQRLRTAFTEQAKRVDLELRASEGITSPSEKQLCRKIDETHANERKSGTKLRRA